MSSRLSVKSTCGHVGGGPEGMVLVLRGASGCEVEMLMEDEARDVGRDVFAT